MIQLAAFWKKNSKNDRTYYQGKMGTGKLLLFENEKKTEENQPDMILYIVEDEKRKEG